MKRRVLLLVMTIFFIVPNGYSQSEVFFLGHQYGIGARSMSMGGAFLAVSDDYTATYWNPAGLAQIRRMEMLGALSHLMLNNEASSDDISFEDKTNATKLNAIGFVFPYPTYRGSMVFAIGYNRIRTFDSGFFFDGLFHADTDTAYQEANTELEEGSLTNWVMSGAIDVTKNLSVGVSLNIWRGNNAFEKIVTYDDITNMYYYDYDANFKIGTEYNAFNFKLGALYRVGPLGRIGITLSTPLTLNVEENWAYDEYWYHPYYEPDSSDNSFQNKYKIKAPFIFGVGAAFTLFPNLTVAADIKYSDWSQLKYETESPNIDDPDANTRFKRNYQATAELHLGAEFTVPLLNLQLRAGYFNKPSPLRPVDFNKQIQLIENIKSSSDKQFLTAGVGMLLDKQVKLDVAWIKGWWESESNLYYGYAPITEKIQVNNFLATVAIRF